MKIGRAIVAGLAGALLMTAAMYLLRLAGFDISLEQILGSAVGESVALGFVVHLGIGVVAALLYAAAFEFAFQRSGAAAGAGLGLCHAFLAALCMSAIPSMSSVLQNLSTSVPIFVALHLLFGATVGILYGPTVQHEHTTGGHPVSPRV